MWFYFQAKYAISPYIQIDADTLADAYERAKTANYGHPPQVLHVSTWVKRRRNFVRYQKYETVS